MGTKSQQACGTKVVGMPPSVSGREALLYIKELAESLREIAVELDHAHLANLLAQASAEASRLADLT
jgi:hypothetical protein